MSADAVFLFSSRAASPHRFFQGYFFHGTDYVVGQSGFEAFCRTRGVDRLVREDGCYVQAEKAGDAYRFSADYSGFKKIFYFWDGGFWAVSNSLHRLAGHLRKHGYAVLPNVPQLAAMATEGTFYPSGRGSFFSQMTSFDTIVRGVRLVPVDCALWIGPSRVGIEKTLCSPSADAYPGHLERFVGKWIGRLKVLVRQPSFQISCDLTGGLDSRVVFALLLSAIRGSSSDIDERLRIHAGGVGFRARRDRAVAGRLCEHFGLPLNGRLAKSPTWLTGEASYALWKDLCLGVYHPIHFPGWYPSGDMISLGGGGGENHRPFYGQFFGAPSPDEFVARRTANIALRSARAGFEASLQQAIDAIMEGAPANLDALACHYRHFRNRFHAGLWPQYSVAFHPLASRLLDGIAAVGGAGRFRNGQTHYDLLYNLQPELLDFPFDKRRKRPDRAARRRLIRITVSPYPAGDCFIGDFREPSANRKGKGAGALDHLREDFARAKGGFALGFLGNAYLRRAERALQQSARTGRFSGPIESKRIAVVIACGMFDPSASSVACGRPPQSRENCDALSTSQS